MPSRESTPIGAPCWIDLRASDLERAAAFYGGLFGWTRQPGDEHGGHVTFLSDGRAVAGMMPAEPGGRGHDGWTTYLATGDVEATARAAVEAGGTVELEPMSVPGQGRMALFRDVSGAEVGAWQPGERAGFGVIAENGAPSWFELVTKDYDAVLPFYGSVFGWDLVTFRDSDEFRYSTGNVDGSQVAGVFDAGRALADEVPSHWQMFVQVDDTDAAVARVPRLGGAVLTRPWDTEFGRMAQIADPGGAPFMISGPAADD